jgi:hypothetical protein
VILDGRSYRVFQQGTPLIGCHGRRMCQMTMQTHQHSGCDACAWKFETQSPLNGPPSKVTTIDKHAKVRKGHSFLIRRNTWQQKRKHAPLISNSPGDDIRYCSIIRCCLTSNDGLPPLKTCGTTQVFHCLNESSVAHHQPKL